MLPDRQSQKFEPAQIYGGLQSFLVFTKKQKDQDQSAQENDMYRDWYRKNVMCEDALDSNILFSKLFQNLQIRSTSEAIAETAGSTVARTGTISPATLTESCSWSSTSAPSKCSKVWSKTSTTS